MKVLSFKSIRGPNIYHGSPVLIMKLDLEDLAPVPSDEIPGLAERLTKLLPGLALHRCSPGHVGGFLERLNKGTYAGHIVEHIALELSGPAGIEVGFGKTVHVSDSRVYNVIVRYRHEQGMRFLLQNAVEILQAVIDNHPLNLELIIEKAKDIVSENALGPSTHAIVAAAEARGIPWRRIGTNSLIEFGYGRNRRRIQAAVTDQTSLIATELVQNKQLTKDLLRDLEIPVPRGSVVSKIEDLLEEMTSLKPPCVIKPFDGHHGKGVCMGIKTEEQARVAFAIAQEYSSDVLVEEQCAGKDFRILVVNYRVVAAAERKPAHVVGDGIHTVKELVAIANQDPRRGSGHANVLTLLEVDELSEELLKSQGYSLNLIPATGVEVLLKQTANLSTGGTANDVTSTMHPSVKVLCERAARAVGLDICGIDLIHSDIKDNISPSTAIIEVNAGPGLRMHTAPSEGQARNVGGAIVDMLYPSQKSARIPIVAVTGTNGKTTTSRLIAHIASQTESVGLTSSDGIWINGTCIEKGDTTGPISARVVLNDPSISFAVLETARGGIVRNGLGYDWSDVGIITNIRPDHLGQDGIETLQDLVRIKSLIAERVRPGGTVILNADDLEASRVVWSAGLSPTKRTYTYFGIDERNPVLKDQLELGNRIYCVREGWLCEVTLNNEVKIAEVESLKFAFSGTATYHVSNALASCAAARALGFSLETIRLGLETFCNSEHNAGRSNVFKLPKGYLVLDYGHNPDAIASTGQMIKQWRVSKSTAILGLPGDRRDELMEESGRTAAQYFDSLILRDDVDRRGRAKGEVPKLLDRMLENEFPGVQRQIILNEEEAIEVAVSEMEANEVIVLFFDEYHGALKAIQKFNPVPADHVPTLGTKYILPSLFSETSV